MASPTKKTEIKRERRNSNRGKTRKAINRNQGTTKSKEELFGDNK